MRKYEYVEFEHKRDYAWWINSSVDHNLDILYVILNKLDDVTIFYAYGMFQERLCPYA